MKFFTKFNFLFLFFALFFLGKGIEVKAQDYNEPVIFTRDPNAVDAHWFRFVMNGYFMRADRDNGNRVIADSKLYDYGDDQLWCLVYQSATYPANQAGTKVKLYNKGTGLYAYVGYRGYIYLNNTGDVFTVSDANYQNFEFFLDVNGNRLNSYGPGDFRVYRHNLDYGPGTPNMKGAAIMQQGIPLSLDEMADIIPYLNSEGKAGGLTAEQLSGLKTMLQNANDKITVTNENGLNIYRPIGAYDAIRDELRKLQNNVAGHTSTLPDGFYRIKNASRQFYNLTQVKANNLDYAGLNPVLYANGTDVKWRMSANSEDEIWQVKNNGNGTYTLTHMLTGNKYVTAGTPNAEDANELTAGAASGNIITMNPAKYPGHFALQFGGNVAHALGHGNGSGTSGDVAPYQWGGEDALHSFATTGNDLYSEPSGWLFEPVDVPRLTDQEEANMKALLNAKNVVDGFTAAQLANLENLEDQYKQGNSSAEFLSSLRAEIS
ncbi:MAG: hypothetical protein PUK67_02795, partial [Prevotellaceae bacterium]|nr:hypothetical protein [Prevotellaceae bacterium]MDY3364711.1 hypothetical protein [Prevotella sp.]